MALITGHLTKSNFLGGMLFSMNDNVAPDNAVAFVNNMLPDPLGAVTTRNGRTRRQDTVIGDVVYDTFRWLGSDGSYRDIVAHKSGSNMVYGHADGTGALNNTITGLTDGNPVIGMQSSNRLYLCNGNDNPKAYVFDSTVQTRDMGLGVGPDLSSITPTDGGAGAIAAGTYKYRITAVYGADGESDPGLESAAAVTIAASKQINVHDASSWSHQTTPAGMTRTFYNVYRNKSPDTHYQFIAQIAASSTTYVDSITAPSQERLADNHNPPPTKATGMVWWDRENVALSWGENAEDADSNNFPSRIYISDIGKPELYRTTEATDNIGNNPSRFLDVPQLGNDNPVIAVVVAGSFAYVFNRSGVRVLVPTAVAQVFTVDLVSNSEDHGIIGPKAVTVTDSGDIYYVSTDGFRLIRGKVDIEISPNTDSATQGLVTRGAVGEIGPSVNSLFHAIPESLRQYVYVHEFRDQVHISLATSAVSNVTPTKNNDVLIYDLPTNSFVYSTGRNVYGWRTINDSGNPYDLLSCGYTIPDDAPTTTQGNFWKEYVTAATTDEDAEGKTLAINWQADDFNRAVPNFGTAKLIEGLFDISASTGVVTVQIDLDSDRHSTTKQFTFSTANRTSWQGVSFWQSDPANDMSGDAGFGTGVALTTLVALFTAVTDGEFRIVINASNKDVTGLDFSTDTTIEQIVSRINTALDAVPATAHVDFVKSPGYFRFTHDDVGASNSVTDVLAIPAGGGTNIATAALLGTGSAEIVNQAVDAPVGSTGLEWFADTVAVPTAIKHFWSSGSATRGKPKRALFHGERANQIGVSIRGNTKMTIFGHSISYHLLGSRYGGVT